MDKNHNILITVSRQLASGGTFIAYSVARELGFTYLDNEVLYKAAKFLGTDERELSDREERVSGFIERVVQSFSFGAPEAPYVPTSRRPVYDTDLFDAEARIIQEAAGNYNAVIVGRAGFHILREYPGLVKVFVHAPLDFRVKRLMKIHNISAKNINIAKAKIEESDERKGKFLRSLTGEELTDARNYHLCIDTSSTGFKEAVEMIVKLVERIRLTLNLKQGGRPCLGEL
ncbi:MAG: AAA family ATPase [Dissulfurispiraceae bacterium]